MKNKKWLIIGVIIVIAVVIVGVITNYIDSSRVTTNHEPKFCIKTISSDGCKVTYWGLGYKVIRYVGVSPNEPYESNIGVKMGSWFMKYELPKDIKMKIEYEGKTVTISGSGNVAIYACEKATQLGAKVVTMSDSNGFVYDPEGIDLDLVKDIKEVRRGRIKEYVEKRPNATYTPNARPWTVACDIALPCATQNELDLEDAKALVANKVFAVCEGANMPTTPEAIHYLMKNGVFYAPGKASNAGGVACSGLEMSQNAQHLSCLLYTSPSPRDRG